MEFDKRITDISKIMNCFTVQDAKRYLHTNGYFADHIEDFAELDKIDMTELAGIEQDFKYPYVGYCIDKFKFFLPCAFVADEEERKEKKYRQYKTIEEFVNHVGLREHDKVQFIGFRNKHNARRYYLAYNGYVVDTTGTIYIHLGSLAFTFYDLFTSYEYELNSFEWLPFGVEVEDK